MRLGVFSWNIGNNFKEDTFRNIFDELEQYEKCEVIVFGFQEVPGTLITNMDTFIENLLLKTTINSEKYNNFRKVSSIHTCSTNPKGFGIYTFVFANIDSELFKDGVVELSNNGAFCKPMAGLSLIGTKGWTATRIRIFKKTIDIVNTHMPFKNVESSQKFSEAINNWLEENNFITDNRIIFGDLNTRSLLTSECYKKDIAMCSPQDSDNYCFISNYLEDLEFEDTIHLPAEVFKLPEPKCQTDCSIEGVDISLEDISDFLLNSDLIGNPPLSKQCSLFNEYDEADIRFYPTYKRDKDSGKFSLHKDQNGRLPGYADRIIYTTDGTLKPEIYTSLPITGNDHLPVFKIFNCKDVARKIRRHRRVVKGTRPNKVGGAKKTKRKYRSSKKRYSKKRYSKKKRYGKKRLH